MMKDKNFCFLGVYTVMRQQLIDNHNIVGKHVLNDEIVELQSLGTKSPVDILFKISLKWSLR